MEERKEGSQASVLSDYVAQSEEWVQADLRMMADDGWGKIKKQDKKEGITAWARSIEGSSVACFKVVGDIVASAADLKDLLHDKIVERQHEWHVLFIKGEIVEELTTEDGKELSMCYMQYKSPSFIVSPRDCAYVKVYKELDQEGAFILTYRTVPHKDIAEKVDKFERTSLLIGSHMIEPLPDKPQETCRLTYIQQAPPGGSVPIWLSNHSQVGIIMDEFRAIRKALGQKKEK